MSTINLATQELQLLLDRLSQATFLLKRNADGSIAFAHVHGQLAQELRMTTAEVAGLNPVQFFGSDLLRQQMIQAWSGQESTMQFRFKRRQLSCRLEPILKDGEVTEVIGTVIDVTEQRKIERKLSLFAHTLSSLNEAVSITDSDDFILYVNPAFCSLYGYTEEEVLNKASSILWSDRNPKEVTEPILRDTLNGGWRGYLFNRSKNDEHFMIYLHTSAVRDENGDVIGCVGIADRVDDHQIIPGKLTDNQPKHGLKGQIYLKQKEEALQSLQAISTEGSHVPSVEMLKEYFQDVLILQSPSKTSGNISLWVTRQLDMKFLALIEDQEPDEISSYRSLMVSGLLNQIVNHGLISMPDQVLDKVHRLFSPFLSLNYNVSGSDPQINISLCQLNAPGTALRFAGANMGLFVVLSTEDKVRWLEGEQQPIQRSEGQPVNRYFKLTTVNTQSGDVLYLFSNSLFSLNEGHAKLGLAIEQFKEWLLKNKERSFVEQRSLLKQYLNEKFGASLDELSYVVVGLRI